MKQKYQRGALNVSILINILLGAGILSVLITVFVLNNRETAVDPATLAYTAAPKTANISGAKAPANGAQIDSLKSTLEIETLKLEQLRIQTERVRASQRRTQSVAPAPAAGITQPDTTTSNSSG